MRIKTICLSLLLLVSFNLGIQLFVSQAPTASAAIIGLGNAPSQDTVQNKRKFTYESLNIRGKATLTIFTVQCNSPTECADASTRGIAERWVIDPSQGGTDNELVFTPTNEAGTSEDLHSPKLVVSKTNLSTGTVSNGTPGKFWSFGINSGAVAKSLVGGTVGEKGVGGGSDESGIPGTAPDPGSDTTDDTSCESQGILGWLICPVIYLLDNATGWLDDQINNLLTIQEESYTNPQLRQVWGRMRNIAYSILVPIILIMVISTALGFELVSAYSVKKALPRFVLAIIFIALSWQIVTFLITLSNNVGQGILGLLTSPFDDINIRQIIGAVGGGATTVIAPGVIGWAVLAGHLSFGIVALYAGTALLFMFAVFVVLTLRQIFILVALLFAPLAILAWIFPGNDKLWKLWWQTFSKLLLMFPLIMAVIAGGRIFAAVINISNDADILNTMLKITAYLVPYAFIPFTFKFAGGLFATLSGMVNDRGKGVFDKLSQARTKQREELGERAGRGARFNPQGKLARFNSAGSWAKDPWNSGKIALGTASGKALAGELTQKSFEQTQKLSEIFSRTGMNDEALRAFIRTDGDLGRLQKEISDLEKSSDPNKQLAAQQLRTNSAFLHDAFKSEEYGRGSVMGAAGLALAQQGFIEPGDIAAISNSLEGKAQGMGSMFKTTAELLGAKGGALTKPGYTVQLDASGRFVAGDMQARATQAARLSTADLGGAKGAQISKQFGDAFQAILTGEERVVVDSETGASKTQLVSRDASGNEVVIDNMDAGIQDAVRETITQAYASYTTADARKRFRDILVGSAISKLGPGATDEDRQKAIDEVDKTLRRATQPRPDDLNSPEEPQQPSPSGPA